MHKIKLIIYIALIAFMVLPSQFCGAAEKYDEISQKYGFTLEEEREIGFQSTISIIKKYGHYKNKKVNDYVNFIGGKIVSNMSKRPDIDYNFIVLDTDEVNAFAAPGGFVFITKGSLKVIYNEAELASVLAHEVVHVEEGHGLEAIAGDSKLRENLRAVKSTVGSGQGLSQNFEEYLEKELTNYNQDSQIINLKNLRNKFKK